MLVAAALSKVGVRIRGIILLQMSVTCIIAADEQVQAVPKSASFLVFSISSRPETSHMLADLLPKTALDLVKHILQRVQASFGRQCHHRSTGELVFEINAIGKDQSGLVPRVAIVLLAPSDDLEWSLAADVVDVQDVIILLRECQ